MARQLFSDWVMDLEWGLVMVHFILYWSPKGWHYKTFHSGLLFSFISPGFVFSCYVSCHIVNYGSIALVHWYSFAVSFVRFSVFIIRPLSYTSVYRPALKKKSSKKKFCALKKEWKLSKRFKKKLRTLLKKNPAL